MALSDMAVFNEYAYNSFTEVLRQQTDLFNAATGGAIQLQSAAHQGSFSEEAFFKKIAGGLVRRRDPNASGAIAQKTIAHDVDVSVKVAGGTPEIVFTRQQFTWIQQSPEQAGAVIGQQLAKDTLADMLNVSVASLRSVLAAESDVKTDVTQYTTPKSPDVNQINLLEATSKFGDASGEIGCWVLHSGALYSLHRESLMNSERLFEYGNVNITRDPFGRLLVQSDIPALADNGEYSVLGLTPGAIYIGQNNDFDQNQVRLNGSENIVTSYQAEWTYNLGLKGFAWKKGNGEAPTNAQLLNSNNWKKISSSHKDLAGVILIAAQ